MKSLRNYVALVGFLLMFSGAASAEQLTLYAAGSLKAALSDVAASYEKTYQTKVATKFGPSGLLRKAIEGGEQPDVFASANMAHPQKLADNGWGSPVVLFTRNQLCAIAQTNVDVSSGNFLDTLLSQEVRLGTSTPKADPSGDYAWKLFEKADKVKAGSFAALSQKALQLTGGPTSEKAPKGHNTYGWVMGEKKADVFLTYCTNAVLAQRDVPSLKIISIPEDLAVGADYGLLVKAGAASEAWRFALYALSPAGQEILKNYGFEAIAIPKFK
ncbi:MAG: molybdate ABC transporter substrate-binding protein [Desulfobulbus sp.]